MKEKLTPKRKQQRHPQSRTPTMEVADKAFNFQRLTEHAPDIIYSYRLSPSPRFEYVSPASAVILGYTPEEHYADPDLPLKCVHPEDRPLLDSLRGAPASIRSPIILRWIRKDGKVIWTDHRIVPIRNATGQVTEIIGFARDITQQKQLEEYLRQIRSQLESEVQKRTEKLVGVNEALQAVIMERKRAEQSLRQARDRLEQRVQERTAELARANQALQIEIGERERAVKRLQQERDFSESLINTAQVIALLLDPNGRIVRFNPYAEEILGYRLEEVQGKDWFTTFLPERDHVRIQELFSKAINGVQTRGNINSIITKDGRERDIEWYDKMLKDANGETIGLLCVGQDITERRKAASWLRGLINTTQDAVVSIDDQNRIVLFNPAAERIFGYSREEVKGQKANILMADPYANEHDHYISRYEQTRQAHAIGRIRTVSGRRKDGEVFPVELSVTEIATDGAARYAAFMRDVSERTKLQAQLVESERLAAIGSTAARMSHEIGNPLNGMYLTVQLLEQRIARQCENLDDSVTSTVKKIKDEIARLIDLLQDLRTLSRHEQYRPKPISLSSLVAEIIELEIPHYTEAGIRVEQNFPPNLPWVPIDKDRLKQALLNLFKNAAEAMPEGGVLTVQAHHSGQELILEVKDSGVGIPRDFNLFEPFSTTKPRGTGLGLMIVRQIVSAHGGLITYSSEPKKGTTFKITLPLHGTQTGHL